MCSEVPGVVDVAQKMRQARAGAGRAGQVERGRQGLVEGGWPLGVAGGVVGTWQDCCVMGVV